MSHLTSFTSRGGVQLGPDLVLSVAEALVDCEPVAIASLMRCSKAFTLLLKSYEKSITKTVSNRDNTLSHVNVEQDKVLSSLMPPVGGTVSLLSYPWLSEMRCRVATVEFLVQHEITEMLDDSSNWPTLDIPKEELSQRLRRFKRRALGLIYRLADCTAGVQGGEQVRKIQARFLENLSTSDLAALGCMAEVLGQGYFNMTKRMLLESELGRNLGGVMTNVPQSNLFIPTSVLADDLMNDNWIRECMCVFEDRVQRYGPYFAWAYVEGFTKARRPNIWARQQLQQGLDDMNAFELGYTMAFASLQSVVWKALCKKTGCTLQDSWSAAKTMVETEMALYELEE